MTAVLAHRPELTAAESWELVERAQAGDMDAYGELYRQHYEALYRFVHFRVRHRELAEDLAATAFRRVLERIDRFEWQGRAFGAIVTTVARNLIVDYYKVGWGHYETPTESPAWREDPTVDGPETTTVRHLRNLDLLSALMTLNEEQRQALVLRYLNDLSVAETAQEMGRSEGAVKALAYRAVRNLRQILPEGFQW